MTRLRAAESESLAAEIEWLRSFRWSDERIADRLGVSVAVIQKRDERAKQVTR